MNKLTLGFVLALAACATRLDSAGQALTRCTTTEDGVTYGCGSGEPPADANLDLDSGDGSGGVGDGGVDDGGVDDGGVGSGSDGSGSDGSGSDGSGSDGCTPAATDLPELLAGVTALDCATPEATLDGILAELYRLDVFVDCDGDTSSPTCDSDRAALAAALAELDALPISDDCDDPDRQTELDNIIGATGKLTSCGDTTVITDDPPPPPTGCTALDWDRLSAPPPMGGSCQIVAITGTNWDTVGDADPDIITPGATTAGFSTWERSVDDEGRPLHPSSELLSGFGVQSYQIGVLQAATEEDQLYAAVDLRPLQSQLAAADHIVVMYGRTNAAASYLDEGEPPLGLEPGAYASLLWIQDYEHVPHRDSIKVLSCDAHDLIGKRAFTLSSRVAIDEPWTPYIRDLPAVWAVVLACGPDGTTTTTTTTTLDPMRKTR